MTFQIDKELKHKLESFCKEKNIDELYIFGSALKETFSAESDIDVLVKFKETLKLSYFNFLDYEEDLTLILNRKVDLVTKNSIENSSNDYLKQSVLNEAVRII